MRVPLTITIPSCLTVIGLSWWLGTHDRDFMREPDAATLEQIRIRAQQAIPLPEQPGETGNQGEHAPGRPILLGPAEIRRPATLSDFRRHASAGAARLIELAESLEQGGDPQRALIAWERVIDSAKPDPTQTRQALDQIRRLRQGLPAWNPNREDAIPIVMHAGTGKRSAERIRAHLDEAARQLEAASSGILKVEVEIATGDDDPASLLPTPVALWLSGPGNTTRSTYIGSITVDATGEPVENLGHSLFRILRGYVDRELALTPPAEPGSDTPIAEVFKHHISRYAWQELGKTLNLAP